MFAPLNNNSKNNDYGKEKKLLRTRESKFILTRSRVGFLKKPVVFVRHRFFYLHLSPNQLT